MVINKYIILFLFFFFFLIPFSSSFSISFEEQSEICSVLNYTFIECYELWSYFEDCGQNCTGNNTIEYVNQTVYVKANCSEEFNFVTENNRHLEELAKIDKGDCVSDCEDCSVVCEPLIAEVKSQYSSVSNDKSNDDLNTYFILGFVVVVLVISFVWYNKNKGKNVSLMPNFKQTAITDFNHPNPPFSAPEPPKPNVDRSSDEIVF